MSKLAERKPFEVYILICSLSFQAVSAIFGGLVLVWDPTGNLIQMPLSLLKYSPFHDFLIPGLILLVLLGVYPSIIVYGLSTRKVLKVMDILNIYRDQHWTWSASLYVGIMLIFWINVEIIIVGYGHFIQSFYSFWGLIVLILALLPRVKNYLGGKKAEMACEEEKAEY